MLVILFPRCSTACMYIYLYIIYLYLQFQSWKMPLQCCEFLPSSPGSDAKMTSPYPPFFGLRCWTFTDVHGLDFHGCCPCFAQQTTTSFGSKRLDAPHFTMAISACARSSLWKDALALLKSCPVVQFWILGSLQFR